MYISQIEFLNDYLERHFLTRFLVFFNTDPALVLRLFTPKNNMFQSGCGYKNIQQLKGESD